MNQMQNSINDKFKTEFKDLSIKAEMDKQENNIMINKVNNYVDQITSDLKLLINSKQDTNNQNLEKLNEHTAYNFTELNKK
jgi:hypothetical protein